MRGWTVLVVIWGLLGGAANAGEPLVLLSQQGPWPGISGLIGFGERLWFANSVKFVNHNSADLYSYDPASRGLRYEHHLFSQDAGDPVVSEGLLYWPFEDARFSAGKGEFMVTNGRDWRWRILPDGEVFHVHAMATHGGALYAVTSAWRAGLQRSLDGGRSWQLLHDHPTPRGRVSRFTSLATLGSDLYVGLTSRTQPGAKLLRWRGKRLEPAPGWPTGRSATALATYRGWLYALHGSGDELAVWRTDGLRSERVAALDGVVIRDFASGPGALWAVAGHDGRGSLWRSRDGETWARVQRFDDAVPLDALVHAGRLYVGTLGPGDRGGLWGPAEPGPGTRLEPAPLPEPEPAMALDGEDELLIELDAALEGAHDFRSYRQRLLEVLIPLALSRSPRVGAALSERLDTPQPKRRLSAFGGAYQVPLSDANRWYLLWAMALNGHGRVPPSLLREPWNDARNPAEKYFAPSAGAAWTVKQLGQSGVETLAALVSGLGASGEPSWLDGDRIGALTALTGERHGYDREAWRRWWTTR